MGAASLGSRAIIGAFFARLEQDLMSSLVGDITMLFQSGHIYQYAFSMIIGVFVLLVFWINRG